MDESQLPPNDGNVKENDVESHVESHVENHVENDVENDDESEVENNVEINQPTSAPSIDSPYDPAYEIRRHRIFDHRAEAQAATNPLTAVLAGANSDLFDLELQAGEVVRRIFATNDLSPDTFEQYSKQFDFLLRVNKQIAQTTQIELRLRKEDADAAATGSSDST
jgi:hypothetical protein